MEETEFRHILETAKSGQLFTATIRQNDDTNTLIGKLHVSTEQRKFWLCFDNGEDGNRSPVMHGYSKSWAIDVHNCKEISYMYITPLEPVVINEYPIY